MGSCSECRYYIGANLKKKDVLGKGAKKILLVFSDPKEWLEARDDVSEALNRFRDINILEDCWVYYAIRCYNEKKVAKSKTFISCEPFLKKQIKELKPKSIIIFGERAFKSYTTDHGSVPWAGQYHWDRMTCPDLKNNCWVTFVQSVGRVYQEKNQVCRLLWDEAIQNALEHVSKPLPAYKPENDCLRLYTDDSEACAFLEDVLIREPKLTAYDFETSGLQPYKKGHFIRTCSISCSVNHSAAFELSENTTPLLKRYLRNARIKKIAHNMKYELLWAKVILKTETRGVRFDTMLATHVMDNRKSISKLGMCAFRHLGVDDLKGRVDQYIKSKGEFNKIADAPLTPLLEYNALDSLYEHRIGRIMMELLK
jgi:hypothetical protein